MNNSNSIDREQSFLTGIQSSGSRWSAAPSIRKIGRKTAEEVGGRAPARESPRGSSALVRVADERMSRGTTSVLIPPPLRREILRNSSTGGFRDAGAF